jgi:SPP1 gp7 family putative phage head morphogenesis protein
MAVPPYEMPEWQRRYQDLEAFRRVRNAERDYGRRLRQLARNIETMVRSYVEAHRDEAEIQNVLGGYVAVGDLAGLANMLDRYSALIDPWAQSVALRFVVELARRDEAAWATYSKTMSRALQQEVQTAPTGEMLRRALEDQIKLIKSIPEQAAKRVQEIAVGNLYGGERYGDMIKIIMDQGEVSRNKATLIARTETARVSSLLTEVRAKHVGSEGYIWRTVRDRRVRKSHKDMEGKFIRWDDPPVVDQGVPPYHAGQFPNCRCFAQPIMPDRYPLAA